MKSSIHISPSRYVLAAAVCSLLMGCGPGNEELAQLAGRGQVQRDAPVQARSSVIVDASQAQVWCMLTDIAHWPSWQPGIQAVSGPSPLGMGNQFSWRTDGMDIHATVALWESPHRIAWTGRASIAKAIHVFTLTPLGPDKTEVASDESMDGLLLSFFYDSADLKKANDEQLATMAAEARRALRPTCDITSSAPTSSLRPRVV
jgi:hypothetical protein